MNGLIFVYVVLGILGTIYVHHREKQQK